jgi:predicted transglutaminase-like cysteine proteinase
VAIDWRMPGAAVLAAAAAIGCAGPAAAAPKLPQPRFIPLGDAADAPAGFTEMCAREAAACGTTPSSPLAPAWGCGAGDDAFAQPLASLPAAARTLVAGDCLPVAAPVPPPPPRAMPPRPDLLLRGINRAVNRGVRQQTDLATYGVDERWERPGTAKGAAGDCEDLALEKRARLVAAGFPEDRLFLAVVYRTGIGLHTVLVARTDAGDVVLDSLSGRVRPWRRGAFSWLRVQAPGRPLDWRRIA